jgi:hypothetical protein
MEKVNHPPHYGGDTQYEVIKVLEAWLSPKEFIGFLKGNYLKYLARAGKKDIEKLDTDQEKAAWYLQYEREYRKRTSNVDLLNDPEELTRRGMPFEFEPSNSFVREVLCMEPGALVVEVDYDLALKKLNRIYREVRDCMEASRG